MTDYEKLKAELSDISAILEKFPDELKPKVFDILVKSFTGNLKHNLSDNPDSVQPRDITKNEKPDQPNGDNKDRPKKQTGSRKPSSESYSIDRHLDLRGNDNLPSFRNFYEQKKPESKAEFNALAVYYLKELMKLQSVSLNQVYTCYKEVNYKPADHFKQSFRDTKNQQGFIEYDDNWNLTIPHRGVSFVEHDLPRQKKKGK